MPYTAWIAAPLILLAALLGANVSRLRMARKITMNDAGDRDFQRAVRAHANLVEHAPLVLIALLCLELAGAQRWLVLGVGIAFAAVRLLHALGALAKLWRTLAVAAFFTYCIEIALGVLVFVQLVSR